MRKKQKNQWLKTVSAALAITLSLTSFPGLSALAEEAGEALKHPALSTELWMPGEDPSASLKPGDMTPLELQTATLRESEVPETLSREELEVNGSVNRLYEQETDMTSALFQNRDGSKTLYIFGQPMKYVDENGRVKDKTNKLTASIQKEAYKSEYQYVNANNDIKTYFPQKLNGQKAVVTEFGEYKLEMKPLYFQTGSAARALKTDISEFTSPTAVKTAVKKEKGTGDAVEYPGAFGEGTTLRYTPRHSGVKEDIILARNPGVNEFEFELNTGNLEARMLKGRIELFDPRTSAVVYTLSPIEVYDSGEQAHVTKNNQYRLEKLDKNGLYQVTLVVDQAFLHADTTVYPVYVDPTVTADGGNVFYQANLFSYFPNDKNAHLDMELFVGDVDKAYPDYFFDRGIGRVLIKPAGLWYNKVFQELPAGNINSIKLALYDNAQETSESMIYMYPFKSTWKEDTVNCSNVNWNNYDSSKGVHMSVGGNPPKGTNKNGVKSGNPSENYWYHYNITNIAKDWKNGLYGGMNTANNCGLLIRAIDESKPARTFRSPEPSDYDENNSPRIIMNYYDVPIESVSITKSKIKLKIGSGEHIKTEIYPPEASNKQLVYKSANPAVASVNAKGKVTAVGHGTTTITVSSAVDSSVKDTVKVVSGGKAIMIMPGIMGSEIFANQSITIDSDHPIASGAKIWDPNEADVYLGDAPWKVRAMQCTLKGQPLFHTKIKSPTINNLIQTSYGAQDTYRRLYRTLYDRYHPSYDIVLYDYDWRLDPKDCAGKLNQFIEQRGYFDLIFVGHSMGGLVSSHYLNMGSEQRDNVDKHITLGTPYLGSLLPFPIFESGNFLDGKGLKGMFFSFVGNTVLNESVKEIAPNVSGIYALMLSAQHWRSYLTVDGKQINTYQETINAFEDFYLDWNTNLLNKTKQSTDELFVNGRHITDLVDSYYIVGDEEDTVQKLAIDDDLFKGRVLKSIKADAGDGTVPLWSATIGGTTRPEKTFYKYSITGKTTALHGNLAKGTRPNFLIGKEVEDMTTIDFVTEIIDGRANYYPSEALYELYGIKSSQFQINALTWVEDVNDKQTEHVLNQDNPVTMLDEKQHILFAVGQAASGGQVKETGKRRSAKLSAQANSISSTQRDHLKSGGIRLAI